MMNQLGNDGLAGTMSILLVDGDFQSTVTLSRVFRELGLLDQLVISMDCTHALARLREPYGVRPGLILLDLDMPGTSSFDMLRALKADAASSLIPVVVLATSNQAQDVALCYELGAAGYMLKSDDDTALVEKMEAVYSYWAMSKVPVAG